jgi:hypothetical protein
VLRFFAFKAFPGRWRQTGHQGLCSSMILLRGPWGGIFLLAGIRYFFGTVRRSRKKSVGALVKARKMNLYFSGEQRAI